MTFFKSRLSLLLGILATGAWATTPDYHIQAFTTFDGERVNRLDFKTAKVDFDSYSPGYFKIEDLGLTPSASDAEVREVLLSADLCPGESPALKDTLFFKNVDFVWQAYGPDESYRAFYLQFRPRVKNALTDQIVNELNEKLCPCALRQANSLLSLNCSAAH